MFEVFDPRDGKPRFTTRYRWLARFVAWWLRQDWERKGDGWL